MNFLANAMDNVREENKVALALNFEVLSKFNSIDHPPTKPPPLFIWEEREILI